ncbi:unnamed protein product [Moneuplotes crassus]|uniref:Protein kinase domain-containing protein n=1 Tax=Euplotes crassus TaxID=5936 RepID=A0AAD2DAS5_EUPCR|nr:unnamed protein product [Moneuplotes crassus]
MGNVQCCCDTTSQGLGKRRNKRNEKESFLRGSMMIGNKARLKVEKEEEETKDSCVLSEKMNDLAAFCEKNSLKKISKCQTWRINRYYKFGEAIEVGSNQDIRKATFNFDKSTNVVIKTIKITDIMNQFDNICNEISTIKICDHPNITKLVDIFYDSHIDKNGNILEISKVYLIMEYFPGVDLTEYLGKKRKIKEDKTAIIITQILEAIKYLHSLDICYRDLKLDNILIDPLTMKVKIMNFEFSRKYRFDPLVGQVGSPYFMAPEMANGIYSNECDLWSTGAITYCLITGELPFETSSLDELMKQVKSTKRYKISKYDILISKDCESFIGDLMTSNTRQRLTASEALRHPFIENCFVMENESTSISENKYQTHVEILKVLVNSKPCDIIEECITEGVQAKLSQETCNELRNIFLKIDYTKEAKIKLLKYHDLLKANPGMDLPFDQFLLHGVNSSPNSPRNILKLLKYFETEGLGNSKMDKVKTLLGKKRFDCKIDSQSVNITKIEVNEKGSERNSEQLFMRIPTALNSIDHDHGNKSQSKGSRYYPKRTESFFTPMESLVSSTSEDTCYDKSKPGCGSVVWEKWLD